MTKNVSKVDVKNSNSQPKRKSKVRISDDATCVLTIQEQGRYKSRGFDATKTKEERKILKKLDLEKMKDSWFVERIQGRIMVSRNGLQWRPLKKGERVPHHDSIVPFVPGSYFDCYSQVTLGPDWTRYNKSLEARSGKMSEQEWKDKGEEGRLIHAASLIAAGRPFTLDILN